MNKSQRYDRRKERSFDLPPREMHTITCADCGKEDQVPFKPNASRPVYCRDCYQKRRTKRF